MRDEYGLEIGDLESDENLLEQILDRLEMRYGSESEFASEEENMNQEAPVFRFDPFPPPAGCPALTHPAYDRILRQAVLLAINIANNAATRLEAAVAVAPRLRNPEAQETARLFRFFFCHDPSLPVPWAGNESSGRIVAKRFRAIARELSGGRRIIFRCDPNCPGTRRARTNQGVAPNVINLCLPFWNRPPGPGLPREAFRAGIILHEMLHVLFTDFFHHDPKERKRNNAHCFRAFALRAARFGQDAAALGSCTGRPC
jgi:hypothetical protein